MNRDIISIFGVNFDVVDKKEAVEIILSFLSKDNKKCRHISTPNPEIIMAARNNKKLKNIINSCDLVVADGIGVVWASKYFGNGKRINERVAGYDVVQELFDNAKNKEGGIKAYFLGSAPGIAKLAAKKMMDKYGNLSVTGARNGFFNETEEKKIIDEINSSGADILLVGIGAPAQEKFINKYKSLLNTKAAIGIGGCFDVMAGEIKRAPGIFQKLGLEWLYRLLTQPKRIFRMMILPIYVISVLYYSVFSDYRNWGKK